jgi:hypothetical protein
MKDCGKALAALPFVPVQLFEQARSRSIREGLRFRREDPDRFTSPEVEPNLTGRREVFGEIESPSRSSSYKKFRYQVGSCR